MTLREVWEDTQEEPDRWCHSCPHFCGRVEYYEFWGAPVSKKFWECRIENIAECPAVQEWLK